MQGCRGAAWVRLLVGWTGGFEGMQVRCGCGCGCDAGKEDRAGMAGLAGHGCVVGGRGWDRGCGVFL